MPNVTITDLPAAQPLDGSELVPVVQNGITVRATTAAIAGSPSQTQTFLTKNQESTLPNSRYLSSTTGIGITDGGAQSYLRLSLNGASGSLESLGNGVVVKTGASTLVNRTITASGSGVSVTNGDGISGDPTISLSGVALSLANASGTGMLAVVGGTTIAGRQILGTTDQIDVVDGNGSGDPTLSLASNPVIPGTAAMKVPTGTAAQQPLGSDGQLRFNSDTQTFDGYSAGIWRQFSVSGGVTSFSAGTTGFTPSTASSGIVTLAGTLNAANGGTGATTLTGYVYGNGTGAMTASTTIPTTNLSGTITNAQLDNSAVTINGSSVSLGGSITVTATASNALTIGTGLSGTSYDGSAPVTIAIDSTVATLTGSQTLTNKSISGSSNTLTNIPNGALTNSTISGVALGSNLNSLTIGTGLTGTSYNGSGAVTVAIDSTVATLTGSQTLTNKTLTSPSISGGSINNAVIGASTPAAGTFTSATMTTGTISTSPTNGLDIVNKDYADSIASGLNYHQPVQYASTTTLPAYTYNNGASGVGATITANANGALSIGGGSPTVTQRVLVKDEVSGNAPYNGVYTVTQVGSLLLPFILTRATDYDTSGTGTNEIDAGDYVLVIAGTNASTAWVQQTALPITVGTTALTFVQFNAPITYSAGTGLNLSPATTFNIATTGVSSGSYGTASSVPTISINAQGQITLASDTSIAINGNQITSGTVGSAYISGSYTGITGVGTLAAGTWNATAIDATYGGTGQTVYAVGDLLYASTTTALSKLADVATGNALISGGVGVAPSYGKIGLTTHVSGTLPIANGGTNSTATATAGGAAYGTGSAFAFTAAGTAGQVLTSQGASAPTWSGISGGTF